MTGDYVPPTPEERQRSLEWLKKIRQQMSGEAPDTETEEPRNDDDPGNADDGSA